MTDVKKPILVIGNKNYSSWSFRAWLVLTKAGVDFDEVYIPLFSDGYKERLLRYSPSGKVPVFLDKGIKVWDTLAIAEYAAEYKPDLWPKEKSVRAYARSISAEMHAGFQALREDMPMNCRASKRKVQQSVGLNADIKRIQAIWTKSRQDFGASGPWLLGSFSIADVMYAPVVSRFQTYGVECDAVGTDYMMTVLEDKDVQTWLEAAKQESEVIARAEVGQ